MLYTSYKYIFPPRAETVIHPDLLSRYENKGWISQAKKNGTNSVIFVSPEKEIFAKSRHNADHKLWSFNDDTSRIFKALYSHNWYVFNGELIHSKVKGMRNIHYLHDILVNDGEYLLGTTYAQRYAILFNLFQNIGSTSTHWILDEHTWLARNIRSNFIDIFHNLTNNEDEGLVLKKMDGILTVNDGAGASWMIKSRKAHKNYNF